MQKGKRVTSLLLAALIAVSASAVAVPPVSAAESGTVASENNVSGDFKYDVLDDGTVEITGYTVEATDLVIPSEIDGKKVTSIGGYALVGCTSLKSVTIPSTVTDIGYYAFGYCYDESQWKYVKIDGFTINGYTNSIAERYARENGIEFKSIGTVSPWIYEELYDDITITKYIGNEADVEIPSEIDGKKVTSIGWGAFDGCESLTSISIPSSVTSIDDGTFYGCKSLKSIIVDRNNNTYSSVDGVLFNKDNTELIYCPCGKVGEYAIPDSVTSIGNRSFLDCKSLIYVTIPDSVTSIGDCAFQNCTSLTNVTIPNGITSISDYAFGDCTSLTSVTIPDTVTSIGEGAFSNCENLTILALPNSVTSIRDFAFSGTAWYKNQPDGLVYSGKVLYGYKGNMPENTSIEVKDGTLGIAENAFGGRANLASVTIPNSVISIDKCAFQYCTNLTSITIPESVTSIGNGAFDGCTNLTIYGNKGSAAEDYANYNGIDFVDENYPTDGLVYTVLSDGTAEITGYTGTETDLVIPSEIDGRAVTCIEDLAFEYCTSLTSVTIPNSVKSIGDVVFSGCTSLESINVSEENRYYSSEDGILFNKNKTELICCPMQKSGAYVIPNSVKNIGRNAFSNCTLLTSITIPNSVTNISFWAFEQCTSLESVTIPNSVTEIEYGAFEDCTSLESATIPSSVISIENLAFAGCTSLESINVSEENKNYSSEDGVLFNKNKTTLICYPGGKSGAYIIPNSVKSIEESAFQNCASLESATIPDSVISIKYAAFKDCNLLESVTVPNSVTKFENCVFDGCTSLKSVTLPNNITEIGDCTFYSCTSLESVTIPNSVTRIGVYAFNGCTSLKSITIPNSVKSIDYGAFNGCTSLESITIPNSVTSIGEYAFSGCTNLTIYGKKGSAAETYAKNNGIKFVENISTATVSLAKTSYTYTGKAITPAVTVKNGNTTLKNGTDYTVSYKNNTNVGTATVTVTGKGNYTGTKTATFKILPISASNLTVSGIANKTYTGKAIAPTVVVKNGNTTLKNGTDYTVSYKNNTNIGTATVTITGKGNYTGTKAVTLKIVAPTVANVKSLKSTQNTSAVKLSWGKVSGATNYDVYQKIGGKWKKVATTKSTSYTVKKLKAGTVYNFAVRANKVVGKKTFNGAFAFITTATKPANVKSLKVNQSTSAVKLSWSKVSGATNYDVYQKIGGKWKKIATTKFTSYTVKKLKAGTVYNFAVRANKVVGKMTLNGQFAFITTATKTATPTMAVKAAGSKKATVTWKKVSGATGYQIYMSTKKTSGYKKVATVSAKKTAKYTKTNLKKGKTYYVRVRTYKVVGKAKIYSGYQTKTVKIK